MSGNTSRAEVERRHIAVVARRDVLVGAAAAGLLALLLPGAANAQDKPAAQTEFETALKKILGEAKPVEGKIVFEVPEIAENGNTVPYSVAVDSPMSETDFVRRIHLLSTSNPQPGVASFTFTPRSGRAFAASRMRLARTQDVVAVAELSDGRMLIGRRTIKVTIGGCGG